MQPQDYVSVSQYLLLEEKAEYKHEYAQGRILDMAGASFEHVSIVANLQAAIRNRTRARGCRTLTSDLRVRVNREEYRYPDVVVVCGEPRLMEEQPPSLLNPTVLIEVASPSTIEVDKGDKLEAYRAIPSLQEYWIVETEHRRVIQVIRGEKDWVLRITGTGAALRSEHLGIESLPLDEIYEI